MEEWTLAKVDTASTVHVKTDAGMVRTFVYVHELVRLQLPIFVEFDIAAMTYLELYLLFVFVNVLCRDHVLARVDAMRAAYIAEFRHIL